MVVGDIGCNINMPLQFSLQQRVLRQKNLHTGQANTLSLLTYNVLHFSLQKRIKRNFENFTFAEILFVPPLVFPRACTSTSTTKLFPRLARHEERRKRRRVIYGTCRSIVRSSCTFTRCKIASSLLGPPFSPICSP